MYCSHNRMNSFNQMLSTSITWERTPHPVPRPGFSCHLFLDNGKLHVENTSMSELEILMSQLQSPHSPKRRSAAKKLRKLGDPVAGPVLLEALKRELPDIRTWETQYQMICHMRFKPEVASSILEQVVARKSERLKFWAAAACPGWSEVAVDVFLDR